jgi:hypothetical protein
VSPVKYELGFYITEDGILHSNRREDYKSSKNGFGDRATSSLDLRRLVISDLLLMNVPSYSSLVSA